MHLVTGGAGFIGSHLIRALNRQGISDILVVDNLERDRRLDNLADCCIADVVDKRVMFRALQAGRFDGAIERVFHQGACTDTLEQDGSYLQENNTEFSKLLLGRALEREVPFIYASSAAIYGNAGQFREDPQNERPLNPYAVSKLAFDQHVRRLLPRAASTLVGLRYFNVYGPREHHKRHMASMVYHVHRQIREHGSALLYRGTSGYDDGEQRRDFVFVEDVVRVNLFFAEGPPRRGIYNVGSGESHSFNSLATLISERMGRGGIEYVPCPVGLRSRYQSYTQADLSRLRAAGYNGPFTALDEGVARSIAAWEKDARSGRRRPAGPPRDGAVRGAGVHPARV